MTGPPQVDPGQRYRFTPPESPEKGTRVTVTLDMDTTDIALTCHNNPEAGPFIIPTLQMRKQGQRGKVTRQGDTAGAEKRKAQSALSP